MGTLRRTCETVPQPSELRFRVVRAIGRGIAVLLGVHVVQRVGEVLGFFLFSIFTMGNAIGSPTVNFQSKRHYNGPMLTISSTKWQSSRDRPHNV